MTTWAQAFNTPNLISRKEYLTQGTTAVVVPAGATFMRISASGAGGWQVDDGFSVYGAGAAFARTKTACTAGESLSVQVGNIANTLQGSDTAAGDSKVTRVTGSVILCRADRAHGLTAGLAANSVGDVKRDGSAGVAYTGGVAAGDEADALPLGFGGRGAQWRDPPTRRQPARGGGGIKDMVLLYTSYQPSFPPGAGRVCIEYFRTDPGY
jgi:hypothetical protein